MGSFEALGIKQDFVKVLKELNILEPTEIQTKVIPLLLNENVHLVGQAQTGTGKTAAFGLPLLQRINPKSDKIQGLILCPTRELGMQISKQLFKYTKYSEKIFTETVYGGPKLEQQLRNLKRTTHIIVATPGRLIDLVERQAIDLSSVNTIILDEADEMLSMGFKKSLEKIMTFVPQAKNKWLFSATMPDGVKHIIDNYLSSNAVRVETGARTGINKNIDHQYCIVEEKDKGNALIEFLKTQKGHQGIVFCKTKAAADILTKELQAKGVNADGLHGDLLQKDRDRVMRGFRKGTIKILVATDIAARGIDVVGLAYVVHFQLPSKDEFFTHRSGRTGRGGGFGISLVIVTPKETKQIAYFSKTLNISFSQIR